MPRQIGSSSTDASAREWEVAGFLDRVPRALRPILIGGYAVSAYGPPRYSVDVDLALPTSSLESAEDWLRQSKFHFRTTFRGSGAGQASRKLRVEGDLVTGDLYFGGLTARESGAFVDYAWLASASRATALRLLSGRTEQPFPVARPEALWVLKLLAGRPQDITDLFAMVETPVDLAEIASKLGTLNGPSVTRTIQRTVYRVSADKDYEDALSRRGLGSPRLAKNKRLWASFREIIENLARALAPAESRAPGASTTSKR